MTTPDRLVHWTGEEQAASIVEMGVILPIADPNTSAPDLRCADRVETVQIGRLTFRQLQFDEPGVIWLTEEDDPYLEGMLGAGKMAVALLIDVRGLDVEPWLDLARRRRTKSSWIRTLNKQAGSPYAARRWWITHDEISTDRILGAWQERTDGSRDQP